MHPGPAEAIAPVVSRLRDAGHTVELIGVRNDTPATRNHGGSAHLFERIGVEYSELASDGYDGDVVQIPDDYADSLFDNFAPDRVLVGCSMDATGEFVDIEDALVHVAARRGVRSVHVVESWVVWYPRKSGILASAYAVFDRTIADVMAARGAPSDAIVITGNPALDGYTMPVSGSRTSIREQLRLNGERLIVYFGQARTPRSTPNDPRTLGWIVDDLASEDRLIFARHPRDDRDYTEVLARAGGKLLTTDLTSDEVVYGADVAVSHYSTMALKSALLDIPTVLILEENDILDLRRECGGYPLSTVGGAYEVNTAPQLAALLRQELSGKAATLRAAVNVDGRATERIAELVLR